MYAEFQLIHGRKQSMPAMPIISNEDLATMVVAEIAAAKALNAAPLTPTQ